MRVIWIEWEGLEPVGGHGVNFASDVRPAPDNVLAIVWGFEWLNGSPETVEVFIRPPDDRYPASFLAEVRHVVEEFLEAKSPPVSSEEGFGRGWISPDVHVWMNC